MADRTAATLESIALATVYQNKVAPQINRACPGFQLMPKIPLEPGQSAVTWDITSAAQAGSGGTAPIADGATATNAGIDTLGKATLPIRTYHSGFAITGLADAMARWTGNPADLANLRIFELEKAAQRLGVDMAVDTLTGDGYGDATNIPVIGLIAADTGTPWATTKPGGLLDTGSYAGVAKLSVTQFRGNIMNLTTENGGTLNPSVMRKAISKIVSRDPMSRRPSVILASTYCWDKHVAMFDAQRRYDLDVIKTSGGQVIQLDAGMEVATFDGIPMIRDVRIPETTTGTMLFLNLDEVAIRYIPIPTAEDIERGEITVTPGYGSTSTGTGMMGKIIKMARVGDKETYYIYTYWQVQVQTPASHCYMYNIAL